MMRIGDLDRRIVVQRSTKSYNEFNDPVYTWTDIADVAASRIDVSDTQKYAYGMTFSTKLTRFVVRWSALIRDLQSSDRIQHENLTGFVKGVKETRDGRRRFLEITATFGS
ncbi:head-tail adaptor protein [Pararhizobium mangrovi]|nr:head-tail adaptor protein [Pararhizobium mangrovi]